MILKFKAIRSLHALVFGVAVLFTLPFFSLMFSGASGSWSVWSHLINTVLPVFIQNTLLLMLGVGLGTLVLGVSTGYITARYDFFGRKVFEWALLLPMAMPGYIIAMAYLELLEYSGPVQSGLRAMFDWKTSQDYWFPSIASLPGAVCMLSLVLYPYVYLLSRMAFLGMDQRWYEAAVLMGKSSLTRFFRITLPLARPAIVVGLSLVMMEACGDFGTVQLFAVHTFTTGIYNTWFGAYNTSGAAQLSLTLLTFLGLLIGMERVGRRQKRFYSARGVHRPLLKRSVSRLASGLCFGWCLFPLLFGFIIPFSALVQWAWETRQQIELQRFLSDTTNSVLLAMSTALIAVVLAVLCGYAVRRNAGRLTRSLVRLIGLGYALPGPVIALGVLIPFAWVDRSWLNSWLERLGSDQLYLLSGTVFILIFAYLVRFQSLSLGSVESALCKIGLNLDEASHTLGHNDWSTLRKVHLPLLKPGILTAGLMVFVDVMKELPATLMLQPFNFSTLATRAFSYASEELLRQSALWSVTIVLVGLIPVILLSLQIRQQSGKKSPEPSIVIEEYAYGTSQSL